VSAFKERGKPVFYDVDDLVFDPRYANLLIHTLDQDLEHPGVWDFWFAYMGRIGAALQLCDRVIVTNPFLAGQVTELTGKVAAILPNFLNLEQIAVSDELLAAKEAAGYRRNRHYEIAYFSGSPSHRRDLELVTATIANVLEEFPETRFQLMGFIDVPEQLKPFAARVRYVPFSDFITLQRRIAEVELNIVPLQNNVFTNCKSELKFFEAAVVGTVTLASRTSTYKSAIESGVDGFLAAPIDWPDSIRTVLALSATQYRRMVITAAERCRMQYHPGVFGPAIIDLLLGDDAQEITDAAITAAQPA
jgi:glycosyltransferase involved in cell wall biosynthesis